MIPSTTDSAPIAAQATTMPKKGCGRKVQARVSATVAASNMPVLTCFIAMPHMVRSSVTSAFAKIRPAHPDLR